MDKTENELTMAGFERIVRQLVGGPSEFKCCVCGEGVEPTEIQRRIRVYCHEDAPTHDETWKRQPYNAN